MKDCVDASETEQRITDLLIEFDEMGFAPTTVCPDGEKYAIDWRDRVRKEFARLTEQEKQAVETLTRSFTRMETFYKVKCTEIEAKEEEISDLKAENAELKKRLENAVEFPRLEVSPYDNNDTLLYYLENGHIQQECFNNKSPEQLQKRLAELKGVRYD